MYKYLQFNSENNQLFNCLLVNKAVTDTDGEVVSFYSPKAQFGKGSLLSVFSKDAEKVKTIKLDTLVKGYPAKVDFIKIDIEGYEYYAFKGGAVLLSCNTSPDILFRFVDWAEDLDKDLTPGDSQRLLLQHSYNLTVLSKKGKLTPLPASLTKGGAMIFTSKTKLV